MQTGCTGRSAETAISAAEDVGAHMMRRCKMHGVVPTQATFVGRVAGETHQLLVELDDRQLHHNTSSPESASRNTSPVTSFILAADRTLIQVAGCGCETLALDYSGKVPALVSPSRSSTYHRALANLRGASVVESDSFWNPHRAFVINSAVRRLGSARRTCVERLTSTRRA